MTERHIPEKLLRVLESKGRTYKLQKGQITQTTDGRDVINLIKKGYIKRYLIANDGSTRTQVVYGPGNIYPITVAFKILLGQEIYEGPETYYYECITPVELVSVDGQGLADAVSQDKDLYKDLFFIAGRRLHYTLHGLENLALGNSYKRVAHQLFYYAQQFGHATKHGVVIDMPLTHQELGDALSLTRETVSTNMIKLRKKGLIETGQSIVVPDIDKLEAAAYH